MIFVTVGTHEQSFNRLVEKVDMLIQDNIITDEVVMQIGYSSYLPRFCETKEIIAYNEMQDLIKKSDIIICHGGPSTYMEALSLEKKVIVVPRLRQFGEHVNNHQLEFLEKINKIGFNIPYITDINLLGVEIQKSIRNLKVNHFESNNEIFKEELTEVINSLWD